MNCWPAWANHCRNKIIYGAHYYTITICIQERPGLFTLSSWPSTTDRKRIYSKLVCTQDSIYWGSILWGECTCSLWVVVATGVWHPQWTKEDGQKSDYHLGWQSIDCFPLAWSSNFSLQRPQQFRLSGLPCTNFWMVPCSDGNRALNPQSILWHIAELWTCSWVWPLKAEGSSLTICTGELP